MCSILRGGSCFGTVPSFEMALVYMCSILRGGSCFGTVPSFEMAFVLELFHPSRWLSFGIIPSFEVALQVSGGIRAFYFKSVSPSQALVSPKVGYF